MHIHHHHIKNGMCSANKPSNYIDEMLGVFGWTVHTTHILALMRYTAERMHCNTHALCVFIRMHNTESLNRILVIRVSLFFIFFFYFYQHQPMLYNSSAWKCFNVWTCFVTEPELWRRINALLKVWAVVFGKCFLIARKMSSKRKSIQCVRVQTNACDHEKELWDDMENPNG